MADIEITSDEFRSTLAALDEIQQRLEVIIAHAMDPGAPRRPALGLAIDAHALNRQSRSKLRELYVALGVRT